VTTLRPIMMLKLKRRGSDFFQHAPSVNLNPSKLVRRLINQQKLFDGSVWTRLKVLSCFDVSMSINHMPIRPTGCTITHEDSTSSSASKHADRESLKFTKLKRRVRPKWCGCALHVIDEKPAK
jgi:hypothetical protein